MKKISLFILALYLINTTVANCEQYAKVDSKKETATLGYEVPLKLKDIIEILLTRNPNLELAKINYEITKNKLDIKRSNFLPIVKINSGYSTLKQDFIFEKKFIENKWNSEINGQIVLNYNLTNFGQDFAIYKSAKHSLKSTEYSNDKMLQDTIYNFLEIYYQVLTYQLRKEAAIDMENTYLETFKAAKLKYEIGIAPLLDKLSSENSYSNSKMNSLETKNSLIKYRAALNTLLNLDPNYNLILENPELEIKKVSLVLENLIKDAFKNRVDLKQQMEEKERIVQELKAQKATRYPSIDLAASTSFKKNINKELNVIPIQHNINLIASVPIFSGFGITNSIRIKEKELKIINIKIEEFKKQISNEVLAAYYDFETNQNKFFILKDVLRTATENAKVSFGMYKNGKASILDVLNAQTKLEDAKLQFINSKYNWLIYRVKLLKAIGKLNIDNIVNTEKFLL